MAGFATFFYTFIFYSKYGRAYSLELLLFTIAFIFFMRLLKDDKHAALPFSIFALLCLWTHLYAVIPLAVMFLYLLYVKKIGLKYPVAVGILSLPLLNYVNLLLTQRVTDTTSTMMFGEPPIAVFLYTPLDLFAYSSFVIFPIIVWMLWRHWDQKLFRVIAGISIVTWISMMVIALQTPVILHYALPLVPMLIVAFILPFYEAIRTRSVHFHHLTVLMVVIILEAVQIVALCTLQRGSW
jgi:hypothetical protein